MKYRVAIVEDDSRSTNILIDYLKKFSEETGIDFDFSTYTDGAQITFEYEAKYEIIFLDIEMKLLNGLETAQKIRELDNDVIIIFVTNMSQYAIKGYTVDAMSFLLKPVPYFAFKQELQKSIDKINKYKEVKYFLVPIEDGFKRISSNEIVYIESIKHDVIIYTKTNAYKLRATLKNYEYNLSKFNFNRCNNSYLVNLLYVTGVKDDNVILNDKVELKISRPRKKQFLKELAAYLGESI